MRRASLLPAIFASLLSSSGDVFAGPPPGAPGNGNGGTTDAADREGAICRETDELLSQMDREMVQRRLQQVSPPGLRTFFINFLAYRSSGPFVIDLYGTEEAFEPTTTGTGLVFDARPWATRHTDDIEGVPAWQNGVLEDHMGERGWRQKELEGQSFSILPGNPAKHGIFVSDEDSAFPRKVTYGGFEDDIPPPPGEGYRPIAVGFGQGLGEGLMSIGVSWIKDNKDFESVIVGPLYAEDYFAESSALRQRGFRPISIDVETDNLADRELVRERWVAVWVNDGVPAEDWIQEPALFGVDRLTEVSAQYLEDGYYPFSIASASFSSYAPPGESTFAVLYAKRPVGLRLRTRAGFVRNVEAEDAALRKEGYHMLTMTQFLTGPVDFRPRDWADQSTEYVGVWGRYDFVPRVTGSDVRTDSGTINPFQLILWGSFYRHFEHLVWDAMNPDSTVPTPLGEVLFPPRFETIPGATMAIYQGKAKVWERGMTYAPAVYPTLQPQDQIPIGSGSKAITAIAVMKEIEKGSFDLDSPVDAAIGLPLDGLPSTYANFDTVLANLQHAQRWWRRPDISDGRLRTEAGKHDDVDPVSPDNYVNVRDFLRFRNQIGDEIAPPPSPAECVDDEDCPLNEVCNQELGLCVGEDAVSCTVNDDCEPSEACQTRTRTCVPAPNYWDENDSRSFRYCNSCYSALGERVAGITSDTSDTSFAEYTDAEIFGELGVVGGVRPMNNRAYRYTNELSDAPLCSGSSYLTDPTHPYYDEAVEPYVRDGDDLAQGILENTLAVDVGQDAAPAWTTDIYGGNYNLGERWLAPGGFIADLDSIHAVLYDSMPGGDHIVLSPASANALVDPANRVGQNDWQLTSTDNGSRVAYGFGFFALHDWYIATGSASGGAFLFAHNRSNDLSWIMMLNRGSARAFRAFSRGYSEYEGSLECTGFLQELPCEEGPFVGECRKEPQGFFPCQEISTVLP